MNDKEVKIKRSQMAKLITGITILEEHLVLNPVEKSMDALAMLDYVRSGLRKSYELIENKDTRLLQVMSWLHERHPMGSLEDFLGMTGENTRVLPELLLECFSDSTPAINDVLSEMTKS